MSDIELDAQHLAAAARYLDIGHHERALQTLAGLEPELATSALAMRMRAAAQLGLDDFEAAARTAHDGLTDEPHDAWLLHLLSIAETRRDDLPAAERAILGALALEPADPDLLSQYADVLMRDGQLDKAEQILGHAASAEPESTAVLEGRIMLASLRHDDRRVRDLAGELLARDPGSLAGQRWLGVFELQRGDAHQASDRFAEVVRNDPDDHDIAAVARTARLMRGPLWWPTRVVTRFGVGPTWLAGVGTIFALRALGPPAPVIVVVVVLWVAFCVCTWVGEARLRRI
jgi:predicted Zn-dependent protease